MTSNASVSLEETLDLYFGRKAPAMPPNVKELLVRFAPWVTLVLLLITLPAVLVVLGLGTLAAPLGFLVGSGYSVGYGISYTVAILILGITVVLEAMSIPGLLKRSRQGWRLAYYAVLVNVVGNLIGLDIVGALVSALVGFYILFQIRPLYGAPTRT